MQQEIEVQGLRLSPQQKRLWSFQQDGDVSHAQAVIRLDGVFDGGALQRAIRKVVARHQSLRTTFYREPGVKVPFQVISDQNEILWRSLDLRHLESGRQQESVEIELTAMRMVAVQWERGPLLSATCCVFSPERSVLLLDIPALCADRCSLQNLVCEIGRWYGLSDVDETTDDPIQYAQFSEWQNELLTEREAEAGHEWWAKQNLAAYPALTLPFERPSETACSCFSPFTIQRAVPQAVVVRLEQIARDGQTSMEVVLSACWQTLLARVTRQRDLVCWWRCDGRKYEELQAGIGLFEKWVPLHGLLDPKMSLHELISRTGQVHAQAIERQEYFSGETNNRPLNALTDPIGLEYERLAEPCRIERGTLTLEQTRLFTEPFKLRLACSQQHHSLRLAWHYYPDRIPCDALQYVVDQCTNLLRSVAQHPKDPIDTLDIIGTNERHRLIHAVNATARPYDGPGQLHRLFEVQAARQPEASALVAGERLLTYAELNAKANQVAHGLIRRGVQRGDCVGLCMERSAEMIIGLLGILKAGAAYVPIDPAQAAVRLAPQMIQSGASVLLAQDESIRQRSGFDRTVLAVGDSSSAFAAEPRIDPDLSMSSDDLAYVIYTSGSTGVPKGVAVSHRSLMNYAQALCRLLDVRDPLQFATVSTLSADLGNTAIFPSLVSGGCLHVITYETATDGQLFSSYLERHAIDVLKIVPSHFKALLATANGSQVCPRKYLILGGERLPWELVEQVKRQSECSVINHYGPTETTIGALTCPVVEPGEGRLSLNVPIGRPIDNLEAYIFDERLETVPVGVPGELYLGGDGVARGYLAQPDRTAERFVPHPYALRPGERLYRTGDMTRFLPDGRIEFLGRGDHQVKIRGFRIELGEIESVLIQHPAVQDAVVTAREDGQGEQYLAAYLVARGSEPKRGVIQDFLRSRLPDYMVPTRVTCLPALPLTANGKVDRNALPEPDQDGTGGRKFVAPHTATEEILAGLWSEVLKHDRVGVHDNFFDLGGHSLLATQVMSRLRQVLRADVPLRTLFEAPSIAQLAQAVEEAKTNGARDQSPPILPVTRSGPVPLSFAQQRLWLLAHLEPDSVAYNVPIALRIKGPLDTAALEWSFNEVVCRHEVLRTTFGAVDGKAVQIPALSLQVPLPVIDLQHLPQVEREAAALRLATAEAQRPFELEYGPMLRMSLLKLGQDEHILLVTLHHIVSDAWSARVLVREVTALYTAFAVGRPSPLEPLPIQYADFASWQRQWLSGDVLEKELRYWKERLKGDLPVLALPTDHLRPAVQTFNGASISHTLSSELMLRIKELSRKEGVTLFMTLLAAWYLLLNRYTGQNDILVGSPIANRTRQEIEGLMGFFVNTLVLRADLSGNPTVKEFLERVRTLCLDAYSHQDVPFEKLVEVLQPARDVSYSPLFQVMFDLQNAQGPDMDIPGLGIMPVEIENKTSKVDLSLSIQEGGQELTVSMDYNTDLFEAQTIERMLVHFQTLLESMIAEPEACVSKLSFLTTAERNMVVTGWNETTVTYPEIGWLPEAITAQAARTPEARAVTLDDQTLTYSELLVRTTQLAQQLRQQGVGPDMLVGVAMERSLELVVALLGILQAGGAYLPLDPDYPAERLAFMLADAQPVLLLTQASLRARLPAYAGPTWCLDTDGSPVSGQPAAALDGAFHGTHLAYTIYTSGSTGQPKGVGNTHAGLLNRLQWMQAQYRLTPMDRVLQKTPFSFDVSVWEFFWPLMVGAELVLAQPGEHRDGLRLLYRIIRHQITTLHFVPPMLDAFLETPGLERCRSLRRVFCSGEALPAAVARRCLNTLPHAELHNLYGPTEAAIDVTAWACRPADCDHGLPIGRPIANTQLYLFDPDGQPVPIGVPGELYIGGIGLARGYHRRPALTAEKFVPNPFGVEPGDRLYRTGDRARARPDGAFEYLGRFDHQVKLRGFRIELGEIEARLMQHQTVRDAVVLVREDSPGLKRLVAYVTAHEGQAVDTAAVRTWLQMGLPEYMVPALILPLDDLPLSPNGKVDRKALPVPDFIERLAHQYVGPRTPMEQRLTEIWADVLGVERVGIHDNFFDLGGHSLLAVQVMTRIRETMEGIRGQFPLIAVFQYPTVAALAETLMRSSEDTSSPLVVFRAGGSKPPLYCVDPTGTHVRAYQPLAHALGDDQPVYGLSLSRLFAMDWREVSVTAIAKEHVVLIRQCHPAGSPFHLLGWSNGGVIALAMAHELERQGESVTFLGILDTQPHVETYSRDVLSDTDEMLAYIRSDRREDFVRLPEKERVALQRHLQTLSGDERVDYAIRWAKDKHFLSEEEAHSSMEMLKVGYALGKAGALFLRECVKEPVAAPVYAWWTTRTLQRNGHAPTEWRRYTKGMVEEYTVIGDHIDAVQSIQVHQKIGDILSQLMGKYKPLL